VALRSGRSWTIGSLNPPQPAPLASCGERPWLPPSCQVYLGRLRRRPSARRGPRQASLWATRARQVNDGNIYISRWEAKILIRTVSRDGRQRAYLEIYNPTKTLHIQQCCPESEGACLVKAEEWLNDCLAGHPNRAATDSTAACRARSGTIPQLPTRVLFLPPDDADLAFLVETGGQLHAKYTALSYFWGETQNTTWRTTAATLESFKGGIFVSDLPKTMRDAIIATRYLEIQYLWVDALVRLNLSD